MSANCCWLSTWLLLLVLFVTRSESFCPSMCQCDDSLLEASCSGSRLDSVPILLNPSLRSLYLQHNRIASLRQSVSFYGELCRLDLSHNVLHSLGLLHFQPLSQLKWLNVSNNLVSSLEPESFTGLKSLTVLDLSDNRLTRLTDDLFAELPSLNTLVLSRNKIQTVSAGAFESLRQLHTLHLEDNNLGRVPSAALVPLASSLQSLHLSRNLIEALEDGAFRHLARLRLLGLNDNAISHIDSFAFETLVSLDVLDLSFNRLDGPISAFSVASSLTYLDLSGNMWRRLPAYFLSGLSRLETLNISYMEYLRSMDVAVFHLTPAPSSLNDSDPLSTTSRVLPLINLIMTNNALWNHLPSGLFQGLESNLNRLDLSGNAFETLEIDEQSYWPYLSYLNVAYNPLECNCSLLWLWNMLQPHNNSVRLHAARLATDIRPLVVNVTCNSPPLYSSLPLSSLSRYDLNCSLALPVSIVTLLVVLWLVLVVGLVILIIYWRKRRSKRRESRLVMIKSSHHHDPFQHHNGTSPILGGKQQLYQVESTSPAPSGHHLPHYYHSHLQQHHQLAMNKDEYTYHCAGTIKRIPVTVV